MWIKTLNDSKALCAIYGEELPELDSFLIKEVRLNHLRNSLEIHGDLSCYPKMPPIKWKAGKFNRVHIVLEFWNLKSFSFGDYTGLDKVDVEITKTDENICCKTSSGLTCLAELVDVKSISGYQDQIEH